ncbi:MAG: phosphonate C-P lyase system protein PhnH [Reinekea sp.]|nr:phosphonate C-P lyase system protein PhnH [Reinekea sp.]
MNEYTLINGNDYSAESASLDYRQLLKAMSYPGKVCHGLSIIDDTRMSIVNRSAQQIAQTLLSGDVSASYFRAPESASFERWIRFDCESRLVAVQEADFLFVNGKDLADLDLLSLKLGSEESPDRSVTLLVMVSHTFMSESLRPVFASGPGIRPEGPEVKLNLDDIPTEFFQHRQQLAPLFPMGMDMFICHPREFIALPRTTSLVW